MTTEIVIMIVGMLVGIGSLSVSFRVMMSTQKRLTNEYLEKQNRTVYAVEQLVENSKTTSADIRSIKESNSVLHTEFVRLDERVKTAFNRLNEHGHAIDELRGYHK